MTMHSKTKLSHLLPRIYRPSVYQGKRKHFRYFEGWYSKLVDKSGHHVWSVIFGISFSADHHSFIQLIEGKSGETWYIRFPAEDIRFNTKEFMVSIGPNKLSNDEIILDLETEGMKMKGEVKFSETKPYPVSLLSPGIMGWYRYVPFMECYHGVVSMNHSLAGKMTFNEQEIDFSGGKGYMEKDWGKSMPSDWIWVQCNHFNGNQDASFMLSVARIPWLKGHFPGFLSFLYLGNELYTFSTYNNSKIKKLELTEEEVYLQLERKGMTMELRAKRAVSGELRAPGLGEMNRKIAESLDSEVNISLRDKRGRLLFENRGIHAGLEIVGDVRKYL